MIFSTIKSSLSILNTAAIVVVSATVLAFSIYVHESLYKESERGDIDGLSANLSSDLVSYLVKDTPDASLTSNPLNRLDRYENVKFAVVYDQNNQVIRYYKGQASEASADIQSITADYQIAQRPFSITIQHGELIAHKMISDGELALGKLLIVNDLVQPLARSKRALLMAVLPFAIGVVLITLLISNILNTRMLKPLTRLARLAHKIKETNDYSIVLNVKGKKEVENLSNEFNSMMATIHEEELKNRSFMEQLVQQRKDMERLANYDSLTGLHNRQSFMEKLRQSLLCAQEESRNLVLMYIDLDGFKGVNDTFGHEVGDQLLIEVAKRLGRYIREEDAVARLGGDEFLILLHNDPDDVLLTDIAQRIIVSICNPFMIQNWEVKVSCSIGIARGHDANYNLSDFVSNADLAMYRSKLKGKNTYTVFEYDMMEDNKRRLQIVNRLDSALKNNEFELFYQPKVNQNEEIIGFEALLRWFSPDLGMVSPEEFVLLAEQSGRIKDITRFVVRRTCEDIGTIQDMFGQHMRISLNLSSLDLCNQDLLKEITQVITEHKVDPACLEFEVTESAYLENFESANMVFEQLRKLGASIALDDFGTGYSSLGYLTQIKLDTLKIDKQFVDNLGLSSRSTTVTKTIIEMAKQLELNICAEGVETRQQAQFLTESGCHQLQGYLFGRPSTLEDLQQFMPSYANKKPRLSVVS